MLLASCPRLEGRSVRRPLSPRMRRLSSVSVDAPAIAHRPARVAIAEGASMETADSRLGMPAKSPIMTNPVISRRTAIGGGLARLGGVLVLSRALLAAAVPRRPVAYP